METFSEKILSISKTMNAHGPIQWVQDERGEMHYGVQDRMSASSRDEKEEKHVLKYVGDPVFGFKPSKTRIEVCKTLCRDVRMEATDCHNAVILFGSSRVGKTSLCEMLVNNVFRRDYVKTYAVTPFLLSADSDARKNQQKRKQSQDSSNITMIKRYTLKFVDTMGSESSIVNKESDDYRLLSMYIKRGNFGAMNGTKSCKAYIVVVDLNCSDSMKKGFNLVRVLSTMERKKEDRTETPLVLFGNKEDLVGKLTSSARKKLISSLHLLLAEIQKRGKFGVFFRGSLKHNYVTRVELETLRVSSFVNSFYSTGKVESGMNRVKSKSQVDEIVHFLIECELVDWEQVKHLELAMNNESEEKTQDDLQEYNAKTDRDVVVDSSTTTKRGGLCGGECILM